MKHLYVVATFLFSMTAFAKVSVEKVEYKDGDTVLEGMLVVDTAKLKNKKGPGVVVVHDWKGVGPYVQMRAEQLAEMGYVAFVADIYGKGVRPKDNKEAGAQAGKFKSDRKLLRARVKAAYDELAKSKNVETDKISATGYCFGGTAALEGARMGLPLKGVVSFHGGLASPTPEDAKNIKAKILVLHGAIDPNVPPAEVAGFEKEMNDAKVDYQFTAYANAVHSFTHKDAGNDITKGAAYNELADKRSYLAAKNFLEEVNK
jgi:dienelactone hydrolase